MRAFRWFAAILLVGASASAAMAARGVVTTTNGQTFEGEIVEEPNSVTITRQGILTRISRDDIQTMRTTGNPSDEIRAAWAKLGRNEVPGRVALSRKAFQIRDYELSRTIAQEATMIDPNNRDAVEMLELIRRQAALEQRGSATAQNQRNQRTIGGEADPSQAIPVVMMDDADMNAVRQAEIQSGDENSMRVRFNSDVRRRFVSQPQTDAVAFAELTAFQQAMHIVQEGDAQMRRDVVFSGDPLAIRSFRAVQRSILNGCATAQCHGSMAGGNFILFPLQETDQVTYTNFYLLNKYARLNRDQPAGIFGGGGARLRMIDRQRPAQSLLLEYGLPPQMAETPHPQVAGYRAMFSSIDDPVYNRIYAWIRDGLRPVDVRYNDVKYISPVEALSRPGDVVDTNPTYLPTTRPATQPATRQATRPASRSAAATQTQPVATRQAIPMPGAPTSRPAIPMPAMPK